nr:hypothetical protein [Tanacetum cinerariifolium]
MASFDYRLNPFYPIKECSSCGDLYTMDYCCSDRSLGDKIIFYLNKTPDLSQQPPQNCPKCGNPVDGQYCQGCALLRNKFKEDMFTYCIENGILQDSSEPSNDNTNVANALREPFVVNQGPSTHYDFNCPSKVLIIPDPEPFNNQTVDEFPQTVTSFDLTCYSEDGNLITYDSTSNLVHDSPNDFNPPSQPPFYSCEFCGNDARYGHYCAPQVPFIYPKPCYNQDFNFPQDFHDFQQQYPCCENYGEPHEAYQYSLLNHDSLIISSSLKIDSLFDDFAVMEQMTSTCEMVGQLIQKKQEEKQIQEDQAGNSQYWKIPAYYDDDDDYNFAITPNETVDSLIMGDEHLNTISATESDELINSSVENLVPNPSESEGENGCDMPACFTTFSNVLFDAECEFDSVDDQIDQHHFNAESDLIESLLNHDSSIIPSSLKINSLLDEFVGKLTLLKSIPPGIDETDYHPENEIRLSQRLLYNNSSPRPPKEFISENSNADVESFSPFPIRIEDSNSFMEEIDSFFNPDDPMPPSIEEDNNDSERDILILEELPSNYSLPLPENKSFHFDIPLFLRPPAKPPDGNTGILNIKMMGDVSDQKVPIPKLMITLVSNQEKSPDLLSHRGLENFQPSSECPMMIHGKNIPILDVPYFYFYPP